VKTAISLPDQVFEQAEALARRLHVSRSQLYADAVRRYIGEHSGTGVTEALNEVYGSSPGDSRLDPALGRLQLRALRASDK
jgi:hypothetical protein